LVLDKKSKDYGPVYITITEIPAPNPLDEVDDDHAVKLKKMRDAVQKQRGNQKKKRAVTNKELDEETGHILHKVQDDR
jgi:hypothetical protein